MNNKSIFNPDGVWCIIIHSVFLPPVAPAAIHIGALRALLPTSQQFHLIATTVIRQLLKLLKSIGFIKPIKLIEPIEPIELLKPLKRLLPFRKNKACMQPCGKGLVSFVLKPTSVAGCLAAKGVLLAP
ncbi:hypothetical protein BUE76_02455 [Cnuella takakiae]|nr:hypothetical protein BUE76_02455 [Cnuella takakiae]